MKIIFDQPVTNALSVLKAGELILYPMDTTNKKVVGKIFKIKKRLKCKPMILLLANIADVHFYVQGVPSPYTL